MKSYHHSADQRILNINEHGLPRNI